MSGVAPSALAMSGAQHTHPGGERERRGSTRGVTRSLLDAGTASGRGAPWGARFPALPARGRRMHLDSGRKNESFRGPGEVAKWLGNGLQNRHTPVRIRSSPPGSLPARTLFGPRSRWRARFRARIRSSPPGSLPARTLLSALALARSLSNSNPVLASRKPSGSDPLRSALALARSLSSSNPVRVRSASCRRAGPEPPGNCGRALGGIAPGCARAGPTNQLPTAIRKR